MPTRPAAQIFQGRLPAASTLPGKALSPPYFQRWADLAWQKPRLSSPTAGDPPRTERFAAQAESQPQPVRLCVECYGRYWPRLLPSTVTKVIVVAGYFRAPVGDFWLAATALRRDTCSMAPESDGWARFYQEVLTRFGNSVSSFPCNVIFRSAEADAYIAVHRPWVCPRGASILALLKVRRRFLDEI